MKKVALATAVLAAVFAVYMEGSSLSSTSYYYSSPSSDGGAHDYKYDSPPSPDIFSYYHHEYEYESPPNEIIDSYTGFIDHSKTVLTTGAVVGIAIGGIFLFCIVVIGCVLVCKRTPAPPRPLAAAIPAVQVPMQVMQPSFVPAGYIYPQHPGVPQLSVEGFYQQPQPKVQPYEMSLEVEQTKIVGTTCTLFSYEDIHKATDGFSKQNEIGRGGFGVVFRGTLYIGTKLTRVAVKQLRDETYKEIQDFKIDVEMISRLHHRNIVSLIGYCSTKETKYLILELVPNGTLESHLHKGSTTMEWSNRMKVALGCAKGFTYLHEDCHPQIVHGDVKAANILLDDDFVPKVANFGLAKKADPNAVKIVGTPGYIGPECESGERSTAKSDVYSFGVILLELITGRKPINYSSKIKCLADWAKPLLSGVVLNNNFDALVDKKLKDNYNYEEMFRVICCSAICIRHSSRRPSMSRVVHILEGLVSIDELKDDVLQSSETYLNSSTSIGYESSQQTSSSSSTTTTGNFNEPTRVIRSVKKYTSGSYKGSTGGECIDPKSFPYGETGGR